MPVVTLNLRDLRSGERMLAEFETLDSCADWLRERPQFVDVLGPTDENISRDVDRMLRAALRPFDAEEKALMQAQRRKHEAEVEALARREAEKHAAARAAQDESMSELGPNDEMRVHWERGGEVANAEPLDPRPVPAVVVRAVAEWVAERDTWVHPRGQIVKAATLTVWPGEVPDGQERVQPGGQFEVDSL
jgi:hypothetical protein